MMNESKTIREFPRAVCLPIPWTKWRAHSLRDSDFYHELAEGVVGLVYSQARLVEFNMDFRIGYISCLYHIYQSHHFYGVCRQMSHEVLI